MQSKRKKRKIIDINYKNATNERIDRFKGIKRMVKENRLSQALSDIEKYSRDYPDDCFGTFLHATILTALGHLDEAVEKLEYLIANESKNMYSAMYELGCIAKRKNNMKKAKEYFTRAIENSPYEENFAKIELAELILDEEENYEEAKKIIKTVSPEYKDYIHLELSRIELKQDRNKNAYNEISKITTVSDNEIFEKKVNLQRARVEFSFGEYKAANEYLDKVLVGTKNTTYWLAKLEQAKIEIQTGNYNHAINICDDMINRKQFVKNEAYFIKAQALEGLKEYDLARENYSKLFEVNTEMQTQRANLYLGLLEVKKKDYDKAKEYFKKITTGKVYKRAGMINMINVLIRTEKYQEAEYYLNKMSEDNQEYKKFRILLDKYQNKPISIREYNSYTEEQYAEYNLNKAIEHIKNNHFEDCIHRSRFNDNIDIYELIAYIKEQISKQTPAIEDLSDIYYIKYEGAGINIDGSKVDNIRVIAIPGTTDIITMYPCNNIESEKQLDKPKTKRMSQIEKFNKKYNLK